MLGHYFDSSASYPILPSIINAMGNTYSSCFANPGSPHQLGQQAFDQVTQARQTIAAIIGVNQGSVYFTSGATESINILLQGYVNFLQATKSPRNEIVISSIEHLSIHNTANALKQKGFVIKLLKTDNNGLVSEETLMSALSDKTAIVSIIAVNNEIGTIQPINELARKVKLRDEKILFMTDSSQAIGKTATSYDLSVVDAFLGSSHKIGAPKGCGFFYLNPAFRIMPLTFGGGQESGYRPGTVDPALTSFFTMAFKECTENMEKNLQYVRELNDLFFMQLDSLGITYKRVVDKELASPYICSVIFPDIKGNRLITELSKKGFYISGGSACSSSCGTKSRIIDAIGRSDAEAIGVVRISFSIFNAREDITQLCHAIKSSIGNIYDHHWKKAAI